MSDTKKLIELRIRMKRRMSYFSRQDAEKFSRITPGWRKPKGLHSKMRLKIKGYRKSISVGYKAPIAVKYLDASGLERVIVFSVHDLSRIDAAKQGIVISGCIGMKKRTAIVQEAQKLSIKILNIKDPLEFLKKTEAHLAARKEVKHKTEQEKKKKLKQREETAKKKEQAKEEHKRAEEKPEELSEKVQKEEEEQKKEFDKLLTKKTA